jgi:hypothetical protein
MTQVPRPPSPELDEVAEELVARGLVEQTDFFIPGRRPHEMRSSEYIGMRELPEGGYRVWYPDNASIKVLIETDDFEAARAVFVEEAVHLARGRGVKVKKAAP